MKSYQERHDAYQAFMGAPGVASIIRAFVDVGTSESGIDIDC